MGGDGDHVVFRPKGREGGIIRILERTGGGGESNTFYFYTSKIPCPSPSIALAIRNDSSLSTTIGIMENILLKNHGSTPLDSRHVIFSVHE